jgi:hypothetical protein
VRIPLGTRSPARGRPGRTPAAIAAGASLAGPSSVSFPSLSPPTRVQAPLLRHCRDLAPPPAPAAGQAS